jgi:hypothetical protein
MADIQKYTGMAIPQLHIRLRIGTKHATLGVQIFGEQLNNCLRHGDLTFLCQPSAPSAGGRSMISVGQAVGSLLPIPAPVQGDFTWGAHGFTEYSSAAHWNCPPN